MSEPQGGPAGAGAAAGIAVLLEGEDLKLLIGLFIQRIAYRQLLWVALVKSLYSASSVA